MLAETLIFIPLVLAQHNPEPEISIQILPRSTAISITFDQPIELSGIAISGDGQFLIGGCMTLDICAWGTPPESPVINSGNCTLYALSGMKLLFLLCSHPPNYSPGEIENEFTTWEDGSFLISLRDDSGLFSQETIKCLSN